MQKWMRSDCPLSCALDLLGDKWSLLILRDLLFFDKSSFGEFLLSDEKIARNILSDRLEHLVKNGFMVKSVSPANRSKFLYRPTAKAIDLVPLLLQLAGWGGKHIAGTSPKKAVAAFRDTKGKAMKRLKRRVFSE